MKVLFASLARIGDYIQHLSVIKAWQLVHPEAEVHILVNDLVPADLMRMNAQFKHFVFSRFRYQNKINQVGTSLLYPFASFRNLISGLKSEKYTQVFDLTLQNQSAALLKLIDPNFHYSSLEATVADEYLNQNDQTHLIDKLKTIYKVDVAPQTFFPSMARRVLFQVSTSDPKKNIDLGKWKTLIDNLGRQTPSLELKVLSSANETEQLSSIFGRERLIVCNFTELSHVFDGATFLVSLDTSIKHFAAWFRVPMVEISVGSSHPIKNAAYQSENIIFSADYHCRPCSHSQACPYERNRCQDSIDFYKLEVFLSEWIASPETTSYLIKTENRSGNLNLLINTNANASEGDKWNQRARTINPSL